jgi:hypothetical protein
MNVCTETLFYDTSRVRYALHIPRTLAYIKIHKDSAGRNIYILSDSQAAIKGLDSFQINTQLVWDCHQPLARMAERNRIQLIRVPGRMEVEGNEIAYQSARQGSSHPLRGPEPALGISAKVARGSEGQGWTSRKHDE